MGILVNFKSLVEGILNENPTQFKGTDGKSAYELAVDSGFVGTEQEFLDSLKGADGAIGENGKTPIYDFTYDEATGDLSVELIGYEEDQVSVGDPAVV